MIKFFIDEQEVSKEEAIEQNRINQSAFEQMKHGNMAAGLKIKFIIAYDTETLSLVKRENWK